MHALINQSLWYCIWKYGRGPVITTYRIYTFSDTCIYLSVIYLEGGGTMGSPPSPRKYPTIMITLVTVTFIHLLAVTVVSEATRSSLRGCKFQNFPGGACSQTTLVWVCLPHAMISPLWQKILYKTLPLLMEYLYIPISVYCMYNILHYGMWWHVHSTVFSRK